MDQPESELPGAAPPPPADEPNFVDLAVASAQSAVELASAALSLVKAEFALARASALQLILLGFALIFFGVVAWLGLAATLTVGLFALIGNLFFSVVIVTAANIAACWLIFLAMRRRYRNLSLPRTRALLLTRNAEPPDDTKAP